MKAVFFLPWFSLLVASLSQAQAQRVELLQGLAPDYPAALANESVNQGFALTVCTLADDGSVLEVWTPGFDHPAFAAAASEALAGWRYAPAAAEGPVAPWPRTDVVRFDFSRSGQITTRTHRDALAAVFPSRKVAGFDLSSIPLVEGSRLTRVRGAPPAASTVSAETSAGEVVVEFFVERSGRVRLPVAVRADHGAQARLAVEALREWAFAPLGPELDHPAVRVRWGFRFPVPGRVEKKTAGQ